MKRYRTRPTIIEAEQFMGCGWYEANGKPYPEGHCQCDDGKQSSDDTSPHSHVHTMHGGQAVKIGVGDWIVRETDGEHFYPIKDHVFQARHEEIQ